ncbi:putative protein kinase superfamily protein [Panicum miliaceum]|uniref:Serine-threonine/tyrosine-protein kinase catalytic domain-containing protein n=1 Tax=Panicum miliaceum TaxID=4540 RepID=A0A3L6RRV4_PANMI|nr:putative protein kinase superfamily protein [Panicum miliaceum]
MGLTDHQGVLEKGTAIAVKMLRIAEAQLGDDEVLKEVTKLFSLQHRTVAQLRLRGKSVWAETRERLLCFECVPSRSLREHFLWPLLGGKNEHPNITRSSARTLGYMAAPEYLNEEEISKKADTFSFGVLILEVVTGFRVDHHQSKKELWAQFTKDVR